MVSLGSDRQRGAHFFEQDASISINYSSSDELLSDHVELCESGEVPFHKLSTVWAAILWVLLMIILVVESFLLETLCPNNVCFKPVGVVGCLTYSHSVVWLIVYLLDRYVCRQHNISRRNGYLEFYRKTCALRKVPNMVMSAGSALLVILLTILTEFCNPKPCPGSVLKPLDYLKILVSLELVIILPCVVMYLVRTLKFNRLQAPPDVNVDSSNSFLMSHVHATEIGFRDEGYLDEVLEKQADMIRYLKQHNANLAKKILKLTTQLGNRHHTM